MNEGNERLLEAASEFDERRRELAIKRIREELTLKGDEFCRACGDPIEIARRAALPSATRCVDCQAAHERGSR
ncbi:TraR/DksA C4-type zinc finger protein [Pelagerythrobacter marinus]|uniref:TraR/DksA C4-type zinc finger protein n=1 Tax=Pelagerythrobacter marinus TaxID=538382 RepID=UPI002AC9D06A|nr:TraR/DksA C4-type zinc finger protein [Pelagerythrobacter marinus]WPZ06593.1 TraR/DksA C4-type zinc finger protein [Pelagerythrobacter marinus]